MRTGNLPLIGVAVAVCLLAGCSGRGKLSSSDPASPAHAGLLLSRPTAKVAGKRTLPRCTCRRSLDEGGGGALVWGGMVPLRNCIRIQCFARNGTA